MDNSQRPLPHGRGIGGGGDKLEEYLKINKAILKDIERRLKGSWTKDWQKEILEKRKKRIEFEVEKIKKILEKKNDIT